VHGDRGLLGRGKEDIGYNCPAPGVVGSQGKKRGAGSESLEGEGIMRGGGISEERRTRQAPRDSSLGGGGKNFINFLWERKRVDSLGGGHT